MRTLEEDSRRSLTTNEGESRIERGDGIDFQNTEEIGIVTEEFIDEDSLSSAAVKSRRNNSFYRDCSILGLVLFLSMLIVIPTTVVMSKRKRDYSNNSGNKTGQDGNIDANDSMYDFNDDTTSFAPPIDEELYAMIVTSNELKNISSVPLLDSGSPQYKAFKWLATQNANLKLYDHKRKLQRYGLAVLYYSTNGIETIYTPENSPSWKKSNLWLTDNDECGTGDQPGWFGIQCNDKGRVTSIELKKNSLTGALPLEMAFLHTLEVLDITSNFVYMEGTDFDVFTHLTSLVELIVDDNFLTTEEGLPSQFGSLTHLEKLTASYNVLSGQFSNSNDALVNLGQLTHLEIESNFLSGEMPAGISELSNLVYLYLRRNDLTINLDFIKDLVNADNGLKDEIFALWIDENDDIIGTIPTEVGQLQYLASLSMADGSVTGTIPSELSNIVGLRRFWAYDNDLTGTIPNEIGDNLKELEVFEVHGNAISGAMPEGLCNTINDISTYEDKSLTSDCSNADGEPLISCNEDCCTECF